MTNQAWREWPQLRRMEHRVELCVWVSRPLEDIRRSARLPQSRMRDELVSGLERPERWRQIHFVRTEACKCPRLQEKRSIVARNDQRLNHPRLMDKQFPRMAVSAGFLGRHKVRRWSLHEVSGTDSGRRSPQTELMRRSILLW